MIELVKPTTPNRKLLGAYLDQVLETGFFTNNGPLVQKLEQSLQEFLASDRVLLTANGTVSLEIILKHFFSTNGNVVTTPYSYVATANAAKWLGLEIRFADLIKDDFFPDPQKIEQQIDGNTCAILLTQVYGLCGPIEVYEALAQKYNVPLILDAAHAFGVRYKGRSIASYGTAASFSFHATKVFNTVEGGAIAVNDPSLAENFFNLRSFGHRGDTYLSQGINGKNSEVHAAFGLAQMDQIETNYEKRKIVFENYVKAFQELPLKMITWNADTEWNYCYFPIILDSENRREELRTYLMNNGVMARRYFFPSLNNLPHLQTDKRQECPNSEAISQKVLCIPHYADLEIESQTRVINLIKDFFRK